MQRGVLLDIVPDLIPVQCRLSTNVQPLDTSLQNSQRRIKGWGFPRTRRDAASQTIEPPGTNIVNGEVG
jgi:hypothetical protein